MSGKTALDFEYGINTGNRFLDLAGHDEDPDELIAQQIKLDEKAKKAAKVTKAAAPAPTKKSATAATATVAAPAKNNNKENVTGKSTNNDQRKQTSVTFNDNNNPTTRFEGGRGGRGGYPRRGNSAGQERFSNEGGHRGGSGGYQRPPRVNRNEGQSSNTESGVFQQSVDDWTGSGEVANEGQRGGEYRGNNRSRGTRGRGIYEVRRGGGRGRGPRGGGRGGYGNNRPAGDDAQQPLTTGTDTGNWEQSAEANSDEFRIKSARSSGRHVDNVDQSGEPSYDPEGAPRGSRGGYRGRTFRSNRNYGADRVNNPDREFTGQDERRNRRQHDRERRNEVSGVKAVEKKDGEGAHNWGAQTEAPEETPAADESNEDAAGAGGQSTKNWSEQVDEAEKQLTLDEYRKQLEAKKKLNQEKLPQLNRRVANEGEDPKAWKDVKEIYRKKNADDDEEEDNDEEVGSDAEEGGSDDDQTNEQYIGKKKVITIPLEFKPIDSPRGPRGSYGPRGGSRRGSGRPREGPNRDEQQAGPDGSNQQQSAPSDQTGDYSAEDRPRSAPRGGARGGPNSRPPNARSEFRRSYANSARGSREGQNRSRVNETVLNLHNPKDFPSLEKQP